MSETTQPPETAGRYQLLVPIGAGGMATVYLARAPVAGEVHRDVAVKVLKTNWDAAPEAGQDLVEEAKLAASGRHPHVGPGVEVVKEDGKLCLVMEYVEGETLAGLISAAKRARTRVPTRICARILIDALRGLHAAHELKDATGAEQNLVHRDFSPQNILVGIDGVSRLTDFGIAKAVSRLGATTQNVLKGKIGYMSPEQVRGSAALDRRSDVWAAGVVTWEVMAGRRLFREQDDVATLLHIVSEAPVPLLNSVVPELSRELSDVVNRALQRDVNGRVASAHAYEEALAAAFKSHGGVADSDEVGRYVCEVAETKLRERRAAAQRVVELRTRLKHVADQAMQVADEPTETTPSRVDAQRVWAARATGAPKSSRLVRWLVGAFIVAGAAGLALIALPTSSPMLAERSAAGRNTTSSLKRQKQLRVTADAPIQSVRLGDEPPLLAQRPKGSLLLPLVDSREPRRVTVQAADGRERVATLAPGADTLMVVFPPLASSPPRPRVRPTGKPKTKAVPFATTPYKNK